MTGSASSTKVHYSLSTPSQTFEPPTALTTKSAISPMAELRVLYGASDTALVQQVQARGIREYAVSQTTLEDVYLGLTDGKGRLNDGPPTDA